MQTKTAPYQADKLEFIKNPIVAEFMGLSSNIDFSENELEQAIISHIQKFLMELGKGYVFVARQQHIRTELDDYFIDLVFYNYILKCYAQKPMKISQNIPCYMAMNSFLQANTNYVCQVRKNCVLKLSSKKDFSDCSMEMAERNEEL